MSTTAALTYFIPVSVDTSPGDINKAIGQTLSSTQAYEEWTLACQSCNAIIDKFFAYSTDYGARSKLPPAVSLHNQMASRKCRRHFQHQHGFAKESRKRSAEAMREQQDASELSSSQTADTTDGKKQRCDSQNVAQILASSSYTVPAPAAPIVQLKLISPQSVIRAPATEAYVSVTLPSTISLLDLTTAQPELLIKNGAAAVAVGKLMRPLLPRQMGELEPRELDDGLASLQADIVQRMEENAKQHRKLPESDCSASYEVQAQYQVYRASRQDVLRLTREIARRSAWFLHTQKLTKSLPAPSYYPDQTKLPGFRYNNPTRVEALVLAMLQLLFPHFSEQSALRHPDEQFQDSVFNAYFF